jgi:hypothetical protein
MITPTNKLFEDDKLFQEWMSTRFEQNFFTDKSKDATRELWKDFLLSNAVEKINLSPQTLGEKAAYRALSSVGLFGGASRRVEKEPAPDVKPAPKKGPGAS